MPTMWSIWAPAAAPREGASWRRGRRKRSPASPPPGREPFWARIAVRRGRRSREPRSDSAGGGHRVARRDEECQDRKVRDREQADRERGPAKARLGQSETARKLSEPHAEQDGDWPQDRKEEPPLCLREGE